MCFFLFFWFSKSYNCLNMNERIDNPANSIFYVSDCFFQRSFKDWSVPRGGMIFISGNGYHLTIVSSAFYMCQCVGWGGAIWFNSSIGGECVFNKICAYECYAWYNLFSIAIVGNNMYNNCSFLSISACAPSYQYTNNSQSFSMQYGKQFIESLNSSKNYGNTCTSLLLCHGEFCRARFSNFVSNYASYSICIYFYYQFISNECSYMNFYSNYQSMINYGQIFAYNSSFSFVHTHFSGNNQKLFSNLNTCQVTLMECVINHASTSFKDGTIFTSICQIQTNLIPASYFFTHFSTFKCNTYPQPTAALTPRLTPAPSYDPTKYFPITQYNNILMLVFLLDEF